jgi:twinfilin-like protein
MDERNSFDKYLWIFLNFTPNDAPVREKMLYSATKATLKKAFDSSVLIDDVNATTKEELTLEGYRKHVEAANAPPPLTREEYELKEIHESEDHVDIGTTTRHSHLHGVSFPIQSDAMDALNDLKEKKVQYVQLTINVDVEEIMLEDAADTLDPNSVRDHISETKPGYHIYLFKHTHEGDYQESFIFIYSCPGYKCGVKERMVYSSCKSPLSAALSGMGINLEKKIEIDDPKEITEEFLMSELHPIKQAHRTQFNKPKPPSNRRPKT